jgi:transcriptional regulator with XRE-family HTH domain
MTRQAARLQGSGPRSDDMFAARVGQLLRVARVSAGLSLDQAAQLCAGVSPARLAAWERTARAIPVERLDAMVTAYGLDTAALLAEAAQATATARWGGRAHSTGPRSCR